MGKRAKAATVEKYLEKYCKKVAITAKLRAPLINNRRKFQHLLFCSQSSYATVHSRNQYISFRYRRNAGYKCI